MYKIPLSLQKCCVNFICDNLTDLCEVQPMSVDDSYQTKLVFKDHEFQFNVDLSELLLTSLEKRGKLNNETLTLFDPDITTLRHVIIHNCPVTCQGLRILRGHKVVHLEVTGSEDVAVHDVMGCLGEWSLSNLRLLNISGSHLPDTSEIGLSSFTKMRCLHTLNVSSTDFNQEGLEIIADNITSLAVLDISCTKVHDISPLRKRRRNLKSLSMYGVQFDEKSDPLDVVCWLDLLVHLDVSTNVRPPEETACFPVAAYLSRPQASPNLVSLDLSGAAELRPPVLKSFLDAHPGLNFLGLFMTDISEYEMFQPQSDWYRSHPQLKVSGDTTARQVMEALQRYLSRPAYIQSALERVFALSQENFTESREDMLQLILQAMRSHLHAGPIQLSATACLANLTRDADYEPLLRIHPALLADCVDVSLTVMDNFSRLPHKQLHRNILLIICNSRILEEVNFDRFRCLRVIMNCMLQYRTGDHSLDRMSAAICSVLIRKVSREEVALLVADGKNVRKLLKLVQAGFTHLEADITLRFTLAALWSLTDECPQACYVFVVEGGIELIMKLLQLIDGQHTDKCVEVRRKCLGVLSNIAESVTERYKVIQPDLIKLIRNMLHMEPLDVSYLAADILAHVCTEGEESWTHHGCLDRAGVLNDLMAVVTNWDKKDKIPVTYRSFRPFYLLLQSEDAALQMYSLWAIHSFCTDHGERYLTLLSRENGQVHIQKLMTSDNLDPRVRVMCQQILDLVENYATRPSSANSSSAETVGEETC